MGTLSGAEFLRQMSESFVPEKASGVNTVVQFNLSGEGGGTFTVSIANGKCEVTEGPATNPKATITAAAADYLAIAKGELNPVSAFMSGKIKVAGDLNMMTKFLDWFKKP